MARIADSLPAATASLLQPVREALAWQDPVGVLSAYVSARQVAIPGDAAVHEVRVELERIARSLETAYGGEIADRARAVQAELAHAVEFPAESFALFAGLGAGTELRVPLAGEVGSRVRLGRRADVRGACRALAAARTAGVVLLSRDGVRVLEWSPAGVEEAWSEELPELELADLVGPAQGHVKGQPGSAPGTKAGRQRDLFDRRMEVAYEKFLRAVAGRIAGLAAERGWRELGISGDGQWSGVLEATLGAPPPAIVQISRIEPWRSGGEVAAEIAAPLVEHRDRQEVTLVGALLEEARVGTLGLGPVLDALAEGRVSALLVPADDALTGLSSEDGTVLAPAGAPPPGVDPASLGEDDMLADAMIARALDTGADVVVLSAAGAEALAGHEVAATVRW